MCISQTIFYGVLCSILSVVFIAIFFNFKTYILLKILNSKNYKGYKLDGMPHQYKTYEVKYGIHNILKLNNELNIKQISNKFGNWESKIYINDSTPYIASGIYKYKDDGPNSGTWGIHEITINRNEKIISIDATSKELVGKNKFIIKLSE